MPDRWSYDAATGEFVRYSVSRDKWSLTVRAQSPHADKREAWDVVTDGDVARTLRAWGLHATRPEAVAEVLADLEREHAGVTRRLDLARVAVRSVARPVRR